MKITINAFRKLKSACITTGKKITIIAGKMEQGKTSLLQGIAVATTGQITPIAELAKNQILSLVHSGSPKATIIIEGANGMSGVSYPDCKRAMEGEAPEISIWSSGIQSILNEPQKTRSKTMASILQSEPSKEMLFAELDKISAGEKTKQKLWETIEVSGWDAAYDHAKETGTRRKGQWEEVTGQRYGSKVAATWTPEKWEFDLSGKSEQELLDDLKAEQEWLEVAISDNAVTDIDKTKIEEAKKELPPLVERSVTIQQRIDALRVAYKNTKTAIAETPETIQPTFQKCPNCNCDLMVNHGTIGKAETVERSVIEQNNKELVELKKSLDIITAEAKSLEAELLVVKARIFSTESIANSKTEQGTATTKTTKASVEECRKLVKRAGDRLLAFQTKEKSDKINKSIDTNKKLIDILAPNGLRSASLTKALSHFNSICEALSKTAKWGEVHLNSDMSVTHRGWPYMLISESAKWRVKVSLQLTIAKILKDSFVLIDGVDILDSDGKNGLIKLLLTMPFESIIAMTLQHTDIMPDLEKYGGKSYWIEDGVVK